MRDTTTMTSQNVSSWLTQIYRQILISAFETIEIGFIELIDGEKQFQFGQDSSELRVTIEVLDQKMYQYLVFSGSVGAAEAYIEGYWRCDSLTKVIEIFAVNQTHLDAFEKKFSFFSGIAHRVKHLRNKNSKAGSKKNILAHYDLGNDLYQAFLSEEMMYSSAVFPTENASLEVAQEHKLALICQRLSLKSSDQLIEIGTGWGGFAIYAATHYGCHVTTTTISEQQYQYVAAKIERLGLTDKITLLKKDYRDLTGQYDKLVSIEMIEAVGDQYLPSFFKQCHQLLKKDGLMLLQAITIPCQRYTHYLKNSDFIQQYIFPGGCLPSIDVMSHCIKQHTDFVMHRVDDIGLHYAKTLEVWRERFIAAWPRLEQGGQFDHKFYRLWLYYLCYCEGAFKQRVISTVHFVARRPGYLLQD